MNQTTRAASDRGVRESAPGWRDYAKLARLELVAFTMFPLYGALIVRGAELPIPQAAALYAINFCFQIGWIVHNDLMDFHFDRQSAAVADRTLASGRVTRRQAWWLAGFSFAATVLLTLIFIHHPLALAALASSWICGTLYNRFGKRFLGGDLIFAATISSMYLLGVVAVMPPGMHFSGLPLMTWALAAGGIADHVFFNAVAGGLKDTAGDRLNGLKTFPVYFSREGPDGLAVTPAFKALAIGLRVTATAIIFVPFFCSASIRYWQTVLIIWSITMVLRSSLKLVNTPLWNKVKIGDRSMRAEGFAVFGIGIMYAHFAGWFWMLFMVFAPFLLFAVVNYVVHGRVGRLPGNF